MKNKSSLCVFKKMFKDNNKHAHWVVHSKLRSLYIYEFSKRTRKFDDNQDSVTGNVEEEEMQLKILQMIPLKMQKIMK